MAESESDGRRGLSPWIALLLLVLGVGSLRRQAAEAGDPPPPERLEAALNSGRISPLLKIEAKLAAARTEFAPLEPIQLEIDVQSLQDEHGYGLMTARHRGESPEGDYRVCPIKVFDGNGDSVPTTRFAEDDLLVMGIGITNRVPSVQLQPGEHYRCKLTANLAREMTSPDEYTILVEYPLHKTVVIDGKDVELVSQSEPIKVKVLPDDRRSPRFWNRPTRAQFDKHKRGMEASRKKAEEEDAKRRREQDQQTPPREPTSQRETP